MLCTVPHGTILKDSMPLTRGARLGPYKILVLIDAVGTGKVYRARDICLNRDVSEPCARESIATFEPFQDSHVTECQAELFCP